MKTRCNAIYYIREESHICCGGVNVNVVINIIKL